MQREPAKLLQSSHHGAWRTRCWLVAFVGIVSVPAVIHAADKNPAPSLDNDPHLVAWWKFDETSGKTAADSSGKHHDGTLEGGLSFDTASAPGRIGKAIKLDGKSHVIVVKDWKGITGPRPRTIAVWIKTKNPSGEIVSWGTEDFGKMFYLSFIRARPGVTPRGGYYYMKAPVHDDAWHHVAAVVREASPPNLHDDVTLYRDGEVAEIDDIGLLDLWPIDTGDKLDVRIARRFNGLIDDLRIYDRACSEDEIQKLCKPEAKP